MTAQVSEVAGANNAKNGRLSAATGALMVLLLTAAGIFQAYTKAVDALKEAVRASKIATAEPVAANGYQELQQRVVELSSQQLAIHDDVVNLHGYVEGLSRASGLNRAPQAAAAGHPYGAIPAPAFSTLPSLKAAPKLVKPRPVSEIQEMTPHSAAE